MGAHLKSREVDARPRWWLLGAGILITPLVGFGVLFASCEYALDHIDNAGINATFACLGFAEAYPANAPARMFSGGFKPPAVTESARMAESAAQEKAKYQPLAQALDTLDAAVRRGSRAEVVASLPRARQLCAPLLPPVAQDEFGLTTTTFAAR